MADILTPDFNYTYPGLLATEFFYKPTVQTPDMLRLFTVRTGIKSKEQLPLVLPMSNITKAGQGCARTVTGDGVNISNRTLDVCAFEVYLEQCKDVFENTFMEQLLKSGIQEADLSGTQIETIIREVVLDGMRRDAFKFFSFGNTDSGNTNLNVCDGLWTRLIDGVATYEVDRAATIGTTLSQTAGERALDYIRTVLEAADDTLDQLPESEKKIFVTRSIYQNLLTTLENTTGVSDAYRDLQGGIPTIFIRGIEVVKISAWDSFINEFTLGNPNRILYTTNKNHVIGVDVAANQGEAGMWYDRNTKLFKVEAAYRMGYNYVQGDLQVIAY